MVIPRGIYITGTINTGNASIYLEKSAVLKASPNPKDYRYNGFVHNEMKKTISLLYSLCRNISCLGENLIEIIGIRDNIQNIIIDGIYYERKESKNACIKGTNTIDVVPSPESIPSPGNEISYWIYSRGCKNLNIKNAAIQDFKGVKLDAYTL